MSGGVTLPAIAGATGGQGGSRPSSSRSGSAAGLAQHPRNNTPQAFYPDLPSFRSTPGRPAGGGVARSYAKLPSLRHTPRHTSRSTTRSEVRSRYSARYRRSPGPLSRHSADSPFLPKAKTEDCLKCLLRVPHRKCESHKYIRVGGGYRHGYWYVKCLLEQIELQRQKELLELQRLEAIKEKRVKAIKTYIRTKSGRLIERIIFLSEEDYEAFKEGKNVADILKKYLTEEEAAGLESWDKDEVVAIKTYVRTKSGRLEERLIYVSKDDYDAIREGRADASELLKKYVTGDENVEGWGEAKMRTIKTYVRTKSGRLVEKVIMISEEDYNKMIQEGMDPNDILKKYLPLGEGETIEGWQSGEPAKAIKTLIRTKSGRLIEKTIYISADDYDRMMREGADPNAILSKYLDPDEQGCIESWDKAPEPGMKAIKTVIRTKSGRLIEKTIYITEEDYEKMMKEGGDPSSILNKYLKPEERGTIQSWEKVPEGKAMKVVKTYVRTKSGRLIEKTVLMTEEEYKKFQESGGDPEFLKKFMKLEDGETIEDWEKASTIYDDDDPEIQNAKAGTRIVGKDGSVYEIVVDPVTGKKYKKKIGHVDPETGKVKLKGGDKGGGKGGGRMKVRKDKDGNLIVTEETADERARRKKGKRDAESDSDFSYRSVVSAGGTRRVRRRRKRADGTYSDSESYHSSADEDGAARRRRRRRQRAHGPDSAHSYYSVVSEGGTRHVRRRKKRADGTYSDSESYHSDDSHLEGGGLTKKKKKKRHGSDSEYSYFSETSEGGTRRTMRKKRLRDKDGKVIGHGKVEEYESSGDESHYTVVSDGKGGKIRVKKPKGGKGAKGKDGKEKKWYDDVDQFSDATTDSDAVDLDAMTPEERERYLAERTKRREEREKRRREKYGDKYDEMFAASAARKKDKKEQQLKEQKEKEEQEKQARIKAELEKKKKTKSGHEADDESDDVAALKKKLQGMSKEELRELKRTGKLKELLGDAYDSEASFMRTNTTISAVTEDSDSDGEGGTGRRKGGKSKRHDGDGSKRRKSKVGKDVTGGGDGKKKSKKGKTDSEFDGSSELSGATGKKKKKGKGGEGEDDDDDDDDEGEGKTTNGGKGEAGEEGDSDCSYRSEVSEGGTRRTVKMKRFRDADGNVVGYGDPEPVPDEFRGTSVMGREGSMDGASDEEYNASFKPGELGLPGEGDDLLGNDPKVPGWKQKRDQRRQSKLDAQAIAEAAEKKKGETRAAGPDQPMMATDRVPSAFSDATTASGDVDLSQMTEEERAAYLASRELRRHQREERRRAKYGDRYDEIMQKKQQKKEQERKAKQERGGKEEEEKAEKEMQEKERQEAEREEMKRRRMSNSLKTTGSLLQKKEKPKSMVTYEKAAPRGLGGPFEKTDRRDIGPSHNDWKNRQERRLSREDSNVSSYSKSIPSFQRMRTTDELGKGGTTRRRMPDRGELIDREKQRQIAEDAKKAALENKDKYEDDDLFEIDESGKVRLRGMGKKIDLSKISDDMLRKLGIDPNLSQKAKAKLLKKLLGDDVTVLDGGRPVGFKALNEYDLEDITDDMLADDPDLDVDTLSGQRRVNVMMRRGGMLLKEHMQRVMEQSRLMDDTAYRNDLDEKGGSVDFMTHYRLVHPDNLEGYAKAFVVEDQDLDTVINISESKTALEGIPAVNKMTPKQTDYVFRVLNITDATQVTFRMFAVITALCERVAAMDPLSKHLLEMCNLADIERKLDLYMNMFYHNRRSDRDGNYIKADSLKIELIAGGLNWKQQQYIMEKMEVNQYGEISFLDYMCYIPLFLSMHDNIVDNPLDMSDQKYTLPPRTRPPSSQRDMNPLGYPLSKKSSLLMRKQARDLMEGKLNAAGLRPETRERLKRYNRLPPIKPFRRSSVSSHTTSDLSSELTKTDFFFGNER